MKNNKFEYNINMFNIYINHNRFLLFFFIKVFNLNFFKYLLF